MERRQGRAGGPSDLDAQGQVGLDWSRSARDGRWQGCPYCPQHSDTLRRQHVAFGRALCRQDDQGARDI